MKWILFMVSLTVLLGGCTAAVVPLVAIPSSNYLTTNHYEKAFFEYDVKYRKTHTFKEHWIPRGEKRLYAREFGDRSKPAIILMHGFPDNLHLYDTLAPQLVNNYHVISFDFIGWGASDKPVNHVYNVKSLYDDLEAVIEYFEFKTVSLVVHDVSGPPGIDWALANEERMDTLILFNTFYFPMDGLVTPEAIVTFSTPSLKRSLLRTSSAISKYGWVVGYESQMKRFFYNHEVRQQMLPVMTHHSFGSRNAFLALNEVLREETDNRKSRAGDLSGYQKPVKIIFGEEDPYLNPKVARGFSDLFPNASVCLIPDAAHFVQLDQAEAVMHAIIKC